MRSLTYWLRSRRAQRVKPPPDLASWSAEFQHDLTPDSPNSSPDPAWLAELERRIDEAGNEPDIEATLEIWANLRRRQGEAAAARIERDGPDPEWLANLERRLDELAATETNQGRDPGALKSVEVNVEDGIRVLVRARDGSDSETSAMAEQALKRFRWMTITPPHTTITPPRTTVPGPRDSTVIDRRVLSFVDEKVRMTALRILRRDLGRLDDVEQDSARDVRRHLVTAMVVAALVGAVAMARGWYLVSMVLLLCAVACDLLEGSVGRLAKVETPRVRWGSFLFGHLAEAAFVIAIAVDQYRLHQPIMAFALLVAVAVALYGSMARLTSRLAGDPPGLAMKERAVRFTSILSYGALSLVRLFSSAGSIPGWVAPVITATLFGGYGLKEALRVAKQMAQQPEGTVVLTIVESEDGESTFFSETATWPSLRP